MTNAELQAELAKYPDDIDVRMAYPSPVRSVFEKQFYQSADEFNSSTPSGVYLLLSTLSKVA